MNVGESLRRHPWRWFAAAAIVLIAIVLLSAALFVRSLLRPQRFTALLQQQLAGAGLVLNVQTPAAPALWPHPAVQLQGFRLSSVGAGAPLLIASEARIVVPWRALLRRELAIERLEIESPRIDLDQLQALLSKLPRTAGVPQLPRIGAGLRIVDGTLLRNDEPLLFDIDAATGALLPGVPFHLEASARSGSDRAGELKLAGLPQYGNGALRFDRIQLNLDVQRVLKAALTGQALWRGGNDIAADFRGVLELPATAAAAPAAPAASAGATPSSAPRAYTLALQVLPAQKATPLTAVLRLDGANEHVDARVPPLALIDWWRGVLAAAPGSALALPPLQGRARIEELGYGPVRVQNVQIDAGADVAPLPAGSAPVPASTVAAKGVAH